MSRSGKVAVAICGLASGALSLAKLIGVAVLIARQEAAADLVRVAKQLIYAALFAGGAVWCWTKLRAGKG